MAKMRIILEIDEEFAEDLLRTEYMNDYDGLASESASLLEYAINEIERTYISIEIR